ncbi:hypothetical protein RRG08_000552 [Elysia crispata]|uniref:Uncharacterized protein n=1 Tax=Elysia crispata TaxID=231223 RepID=A0AAE0Y8A1_9GAST|nr:hypothetical protein RRG08_000552 [Elysia crispata]
MRQEEPGTQGRPCLAPWVTPKCELRGKANPSFESSQNQTSKAILRRQFYNRLYGEVCQPQQGHLLAPCPQPRDDIATVTLHVVEFKVKTGMRHHSYL